MKNSTIAHFQKVSFEEYKKARLNAMSVDTDDVTDDLTNKIFDEWKDIKLPQRATVGSAGYDFHLPYEVSISNNSQLIPTGIRAKIEEGWVLMLFPRSGLGTKYRMQLDNTVGIIDSDYFLAANEGHIMAKIHADKDFNLSKEDRFIQGVFLPFGIADNGNTLNRRMGGLGSTGTK